MARADRAPRARFPLLACRRALRASPESPSPRANNRESIGEPADDRAARGRPCDAQSTEFARERRLSTNHRREISANGAALSCLLAALALQVPVSHSIANAPRTSAQPRAPE